MVSTRTGSATRLYLGCGVHPVDGWVNVDKSFGPVLQRYPHVKRALYRVGLLSWTQYVLEWPSGIKRINVTRRFPWPAGSVDAIFCDRILTRFDRSTARMLLRRCFVALRTGGVLRIVVTDLEGKARRYLEAKDDRDEGAGDRLAADLFGGREPGGSFLQRAVKRFSDRLDPSHRWLYDFESLASMLRSVGFSDIRRENRGEGDFPNVELLENNVGEHLIVQAAVTRMPANADRDAARLSSGCSDAMTGVDRDVRGRDGRRGAPWDPRRSAVLFTSLHASVAGSSRSLATVLAHLPPQYRRVVAAPPGPFTAFLRDRRLADQFVSISSPGRIRPLTRVRVSLSLARWILVHRRSLAVVHANGLADLGVVWPGAWVARVPVVVWSHKPGSIAPRTRRSALIGRWFVRRLRWVAVSIVARETLVEGGLTDRDRIEIIENPIDPVDVVAPRVSDEGVAVGFLGDASPRKGFQFLPDVVAKVGDRGVRWLIFAKPRASGELVETWRALESLPDVEVVGRQVDVRSAYSRCDIVICPSLNESFCRAAAEAMANGIPVVGTDLPALRDLVGNGTSGLLFPAGDVDAAADAVRLLVRDQALRERLGRRGRETASAYDPLVVAAKFAEVYADATRGAFG